MNAESKPNISISLAMSLRAAHWNEHPIVTAKAKLPTTAAKTALAVALAAGRKHRESVAFWAHPVTGKSFCIEIFKVELPKAFGGAGVFVYEVKPKDEEDEGRTRPSQRINAKEALFLRDMLEEMDYEPKIEYTLPGKRRQVRKALLGLAGQARHIFLIFDEAQELEEQELTILKSIVNFLTKSDVRVTTILFGQVELLEQRARIVTRYRSDLDIRFTKSLYEFPGIKSSEDLRVALEACDVDSEFPVGSGLNYTQFLFPQAYEAGFRMTSLAKPFWAAFMNVSALRTGESGIAMEYVASALSELVTMLKGADGAQFAVGNAELEQAVKASGYGRRKAVRRPVNTSKKGGE
jgi:hypothetical protein